MIKDLLNKIDKRQRILGLVLIFVIVLAVVTSPSKKDDSNVVSKVTSMISSSAPEKSQEKVVGEMRYYLNENEVDLAYVGTWKNDPFYYIPKGQGKKEGSGLIGQIIGSGNDNPNEPESVKLTLMGVSWDGNSGTALINGEVLERGQTIQGYTITKIAETYVLLKRGNKSIRLDVK